MSREVVFDKLETLVLDEGEIVTYKLLSRECKLNVNEAKKYLLDFLTAQKSKENPTLKATYFLAGLQEIDDISSVKILVVCEESLENAKKKFKDVTSCHIYSISKVVPDSNGLYNTDLSYNRKSQDNKELLVIKHPNIEIKPPTLSKASLLKSDAKPPAKAQNLGVSKSNGSSKLQTNGSSKKPSNGVVNDGTTTKKAEMEIKKDDQSNGTTETKKSNSEIQKPNTLASMWQKNEEKSKAFKTESAKSDGKGKTKSPQEIKKSLPKNSIMSMFSKQAEKNAGHSAKKTPVNDPVPVKKEEIVFSAQQVENAGGSNSVKKPAKSYDKKRKLPQKKAKTSEKHGSESDTDECKPAKKKHRRIAVFDDSDSNSDGEDMEAEDKAQRNIFLPEDLIESPIVTPTPETDEDPIPPTPPVLSSKGRKRVSKTVKKTFMDDDGFMVTTEEKEIVSESGSDEDPIPTKSSTKAVKETLKTNVSNKKQASLTNFFKKS